MARHKHKLSTCPNCDHKLDSHYDYCPSCGQENHDIRVPIGHIGYEFVEGITHFDNKVWNSLKSFFTKPGQITKDYLEGKRARYVPPPRLYIFFSVIFFLIVSNYSHKASQLLKEDNENKKVKIHAGGRIYKLEKDLLDLILSCNTRQIDSIFIASDNPMAVDTALIRKAILDTLKSISYRDYLDDQEKSNKGKTIKIDLAESDVPRVINDSLEWKNQSLKDSLAYIKNLSVYDSLYHRTKTLDIVYHSTTGIMGTDFTPTELKEIKYMNSTELDSIIEVKRSQLIARKEKPEPAWFYKLILRNFNEIEEYNFDNLFSKTIKAFSMAMFIFMPFIALVTWIFFHSIRKYYVEHLIYSIHIHTFIFIVFSIVMLINLVFPSFLAKTIILILVILASYIILSLVKVFENSMVKTIFKFAAINFIYLFTLTLAVFGAFIMGGLG